MYISYNMLLFAQHVPIMKPFITCFVDMDTSEIHVLVECWVDAFFEACDNLLDGSGASWDVRFSSCRHGSLGRLESQVDSHCLALVP